MSDDKNIKMIKNLEKSNVLLNVILSVEEFFDNLDLYAYKNWFEGELVQGPEIERYWVTVVLKYPIDKMPEPQGGKRLTKHECKVKYVKAKQKYVDMDLNNVVDVDQNMNVDFVSPSTISGGYIEGPHERAKQDGSIRFKDIWLIIITIPKRFIDDVTEAGLEDYADTVDIEDVSDARDENITDQTSLNQNSFNDDEDFGI